MEHPNEARLRAAYAAFAQGNLQGYLDHCTNEITFSVPGKNKVAGTYSRAQFFSPFISSVMELTDGNFRETVTDVVANDHRGVVFAAHEIERNGKKFSYDTVHVYTISDGKLDSFTEYPADQYFFDEAWG